MSLLWFKRGRRADPKPEPPAPLPPENGSRGSLDAPAIADDVLDRLDGGSPDAGRQQRAPLAIRGLLLVNLRADEGIERIEKAPALGARASVIATIQATMAGIRFTGGRGELAGADYRVSVDLGAEDPVAAAVVAAEGDTGIELLTALLERTAWRAYAPRAGVFVEPESVELFALPDALAPRLP